MVLRQRRGCRSPPPLGLDNNKAVTATASTSTNDGDGDDGSHHGEGTAQSSSSSPHQDHPNDEQESSVAVQSSLSSSKKNVSTTTPSTTKPTNKMTSPSNNNKDHSHRCDNDSSSSSSSYSIAKWMILRLLGMVYFVAFLGAYHQNMGLMGEYGISPAKHTWEQVRSHPDFVDHPWAGFFQYPTLFWFVEFNDHSMMTVIVLGMLVSGGFVVLCEINSWLLQFVLWILDFSIVTIASVGGSSFYQYGWESQLLETGFLAIFLCQVPSIELLRTQKNEREHEQGENTKTNTNASSKTSLLRRLPRIRLALWESRSGYQKSSVAAAPPPSAAAAASIEPPSHPSPIILWLYRWLCFRISMGAGLIKLRGSSCWAQRTCLYYHFETQPIPSPLSFVYHFLSHATHRHMVDTDLFVQVYTSFFVLVPIEFIPRTWHDGRVYRFGRLLLRISGCIQAGFMIAIILSGNFAFLNHLTIIPALACFDDDFTLTQRIKRACRIEEIPTQAKEMKGPSSRKIDQGRLQQQRQQRSWWQRWLVSSSSPRCGGTRLIDIVLFVWIAVLSWPVVANLLQLHAGSRQMMNASFDNFRIVNTYGAFGSVGEARYEAIIQISNDTVIPSPWGVAGAASTSGGKFVQDQQVDLAGYPSRHNWTELELPCKPGNVKRRPCLVAPYHYRMDWNIWFLGFKPHHGMLRRRETWMYGLLKRILEKPTSADPRRRTETQPWLALLDRTTTEYLNDHYYQYGQAPKMIRVDMYHYRMKKSLWSILLDYITGKEVVWWEREYEENLIPPVILNEQSNKLQVAYPK